MLDWSFCAALFDILTLLTVVGCLDIRVIPLEAETYVLCELHNNCIYNTSLDLYPKISAVVFSHKVYIWVTRALHMYSVNVRFNMVCDIFIDMVILH